MTSAESSPIASTSGNRFLGKWWICFLLFLATTLNYMDRQALSQTSVRICREFHLSNQQYGELERYFNYGYGVGALLIGCLVDRGNLRWVYAGVVFAWSVVGFCTGFATTFFALLLCRVMLGLFESGNWPCGIMTVRRVLPAEHRSLGNGMFQSGTAIGAILTPLVVLGAVELADPGESLRTALQMVVGGGGVAAMPQPAHTWQLPFRAVGILGLVWVALWLITVRNRHVRAPAPTTPAPHDSYWSIWRNRRFLVLCVVVVAVNVTWRTFGTWLPKFLQEGRGYDETSMQLFSSLYYLGADVGSIGVGLLTLWLVRRGCTLHASRVLTFGFCAALTLCSILAVSLPRGPALLAIVLVIGFGGLGLFPTYFALTQEVSARHQGKVTGTLGCINAAVIGTLVEWQGRLIDQTKSFSLALGTAGIPPILALLVVLAFWNPKQETK